jgi:hypothetical protein
MFTRVCLLGLAASCVAVNQNASSVTTRGELVARADDPTNFGWVKKWAAIGDSFTAGENSCENTQFFSC